MLTKGVYKDLLAIEVEGVLQLTHAPKRQSSGAEFNSLIKGMKRGNTAHVRLTNKEINATDTLQIDLTGFTKAYNQFAAYCK